MVSCPAGNICLAVSFRSGQLWWHDRPPDRKPADQPSGWTSDSNNVTTQAIWTPNSNFVASFRFSRGFLNERSSAYFIPQETRFTCGGLAVPTDAGCAPRFLKHPEQQQHLL
jgi:hypothetical protein